MISIQGSLEYKGNLNQILIDSLNLELRIPKFSYHITTNTYSERKIDEYNKLAMPLRLREQVYHFELPIDFVIGDQINLQYSFFIFNKIERLLSGDINDFAFPLKYMISDEYGNDIEDEEFNAIYGFQSSPIEANRNHKLELSNYIQIFGSIDKVNVDRLKELIKKEKDNIFIINKKAYDDLRDQLKQYIVNNNDFYLLNFIEGIVDLSGRLPKVVQNISSSQQMGLQNILRNVGIDDVKQQHYIQDLIIKDFDRLFEFPIVVPEVETIEIGGTFAILSEEVLAKDDLEFYKLSIEYLQKNSIPRIIRYNWRESNNNLSDNRISFSLSKSQPIILNSLGSNLFIKIKGFDGSILWSRDVDPTNPQLKELNIEIPLYRPSSITQISDAGKTGSIRRLRGKVVQLRSKYNLNELTIVIQAKKDGDEIWRIVGSTNTDKAGNFSLEYPYGSYVAAQALVSLMPNSPVTIGINSENTTNETISDDFIYLLLKDDEIVLPDEAKKNKKDNHCDCDTPNKVKRLPDQADLIESGEYTQDIGGTCLNLSTPNRTLREYSYNAIVRTSDPEVANYVLRKSEDSGTVKYNLEGGKQKLSRGIVDLDNPIHWEDAPDAKSNLSLYQAVTVATGHILYFKSIFKADGYSLGDLVYSLPLAPGQKKQIVVFESSHSLTGAESQTISQGERLSAELVNDRSITDQLSGGISEGLSGRSSASTAGISAGLGVGVSYGGIGGSLGVAGGYANSQSSASQNSSRSISQFFGEKLRQSVMQNAESYRQLNASVVTTVTQGQNYGVTSEVVANHNHCHSMTLMYFEVLRHYAIFQELSHVDECVFVPLLMTNFTTENIHKWKDVLARHLLPIPSNTYLQPYSFLLIGRQHPLLKAFDANERIKTNYRRVDFPPEGETYADGIITQIKGQLTINVNIERPKTRYDRIKSLPVISKTVSREEFDVEGTIKKNIFAAMAGPFMGLFGGAATQTVQEEIQVVGPIFDQFMTLDANYASVPPANSIRVVNFSPISISFPDGTTVVPGEAFFDGGHIDKQLWMGYAKILGYVGSNAIYEMLDYYFSGRLISEWDDIFYKDILPLVFAKIVDSISIHWGEVRTERVGDRETIKHSGGGFNLDFSTDSKYLGGNKSINVNFTSQGSVGRKRKDLLNISISCSNSDAISLKNHIKLNIGKINIDYSTEYFSGSLYRGYVNNDLLDGTNLHVPLSARDKINPRKEDRYIVNLLIEHLNSKLEHYNKVLWYNLDPDRRFMLLDGFNIEVFNSSGISVGFRSLASVVKNELITITGNSLVFPVADGYKVSQSYIRENTEENIAQEISLLDHYQPLTPIPPYRISVPTRGIFMEAIQGVCDSCEMVKKDSSQDWDKFRTEDPTPISPVVTPTPTITSYTPNYKDFASPLVNIQNAPDTPAPAAGLSQLTELLGKAGVFNDITGLQGNQRNVLETYLSNQANAKAFAEMAKSLATQQHNTQHSDDFMRRAEQARDSGAIDDDDFRNLTRQHLQQQIDGGESIRENVQLERERSRPSLTEAAIDAVNQGRSVQAERVDADGNRESLTAGETEGEVDNSAVDISYLIAPRLQQSMSMACWATTATMMVNWKNGSSTSIEDVLRRAGNNLTPPDENYYLGMFNNDTGLAANEKNRFISSLGMESEEPASYQLDHYIDWLRNYGPLWITTDSDSSTGFSPHARILFRIYGNNINNYETVYFHFVDPATGREGSESFLAFNEHYAQMARDIEADQDLFLQIVHFRDRIQGGEGGSSSPMTPCRSFTPTEIDKIILNRDYINAPLGRSSDPGILGFRNWGATPGTSGAGNGVLHFLDTGGTYGCRDINNIETIVLHETGRDRASGHDLPGVTQRKLGVHFLIEKDGKIVQFNDIVDTLPHGSQGWNEKTIGIEFASNIFSGTAGERISLNWEGASYEVPSLDALESCYSLVDWLVNNLPSVQDTYLSHMTIPSGAHSGEIAWHIHYHPTSTASSLHQQRPGIISHNVYNKQKADGWFQALYCWCRSSNGENLSSNEALVRAKSIAQAASNRIVRIDGNIFILLG